MTPANTKEQFLGAVREHQAIVEAVSCGDPDAAEKTMRQHLETSLAAYHRAAQDKLLAG